MADLEMKMKLLRAFALAGNEWALDMLISYAEVAALKGVTDGVSKRFMEALDKATALNQANSLPQKPAKG
jgi:hypothetical protein